MMNKKTKNFKLAYKINFSYQDFDNLIKLWLALPIKDKYQKVLSFTPSIRPFKKYSDKQGNKILYFKLKEEKEFSFELNLALAKSSHVHSKNWQRPSDNKLNRYLKSERFLEQTKDIKDLVESITQDKKTLYDKVKAVFDFVIDNFGYTYPVKKRGAKNLNLKKLRGDCGEYGALLVTMLRILGVPAVNQTGFVIHPRQQKIVEHGWVKAYFRTQGWLDFDPQYAAIEKNKAKYFGQRNDYRVVFTNGFNIPIESPIAREYRLDFWNKAGLPLSRKSVQVLQPAVFVGRVRMSFKDRVVLV